MNHGDLKISIVSYLSKTRQVLLYRKGFNMDNYQIGSWAYPHIAPGARYEIVLPEQVMVSAATSIGPGSMITRELPISSEALYEIFDNEGALDIRKSTKDCIGKEDAVKVSNLTLKTRNVIMTQGDRPIAAFALMSNFNCFIFLRKILCIQINDTLIQEQFLDPAALSGPSVQIDYEGQTKLSILLEEDTTTKEIRITHSFSDTYK